ncbi:helix-turn-helix domain-containing protein [Asticcacaulis sp. W401b]|uniref:helix-turn-helix domain-containing protein n=1 Tax=Asticcacaulis sp. W401b TaxID=3388666 RepID=UPI0039707D58
MTSDQDDSPPAQIGRRIRALRDAHDLNLNELARLSGFSASALSLIETGKRDLRISSLFRIASALRVSISDLLEDPSADAAVVRSENGEGYDLGDYT